MPQPGLIATFLGVDAEARRGNSVGQEAPYSTIYICLLLVHESKGENTLASLLALHKPLHLVGSLNIYNKTLANPK